MTDFFPYDTIVKAHEGDPEAIQAVLDRYAGYIRYFSKMNGYYNSDMEDYIRTIYAVRISRMGNTKINYKAMIKQYIEFVDL